MTKPRCIDCLRTCFMDAMSSSERLVYQCEATKKIIESVDSQTDCEKILLKDPRHKKNTRKKQ